MSPRPITRALFALPVILTALLAPMPVHQGTAVAAPPLPMKWRYGETNRGGRDARAPSNFMLVTASRAGQAAPTTLTIGVPSLPASLNPLIDAQPATADITDALFDSLLATDPHDVLQPDLALRYSVDGSGLHYRFELNPAATWQDGVPVAASDVVYTTRLMQDRRFPAYNRYGFDHIASIVASSPTEVLVTLRAPFAPFLRAFATTPILPSHVLAPLPIEQIATYDAFNRRPIGDGPYAVSEFVPGNHVTLIANPQYFAGAPHIDSLVFTYEPSTAAALADLHAGRAQLLGPSLNLQPRQVLSALQSGNLAAYAAPGAGWTHIDLIETGFLRDHLVREALAYATPRQQIVVSMFRGLAVPADADQPPTSEYYEPAIAGSLPYQPARTATLLRSRGYRLVQGRWTKGGRVLRLTLLTDAGCADCVAVANLVAASWSKAGIPTVVSPTPTQVLFGPSGPLYTPTRLDDLKLNAVLYTWLTTPEPDDSFYWSTSMIVRPGHTTGGNFDGYSNPAMDALLNKALVATNDATRVSLYRAIQRLLVRDQPDIFLYWIAYLTLATTSLHGYRANPFHPGVTWNVATWSLS
jgi:peptide/nickel transport system substrate-binding protein